MGRGSAVALLVSLRAVDTYEQETRRMFVEGKAKYKQTYRYAGEEECRYAVFKESRRSVARAMAAGVTSGINSLSATAIEEVEIYRGHGVRIDLVRAGDPPDVHGVEDQSTADVGEEECRYRLFKDNRRRFIVRLNAAAGQNVYGLNQFGDLTNGNGEVQERCYPEMEDRELSARCQADPDSGHGRLIRYQVCRCIATELKETESGGSAIPGDGLMVLLLQQLMQMHGV